MKYKYTRKQWLNMGSKSSDTFIGSADEKDLLAQKEDRKEWQKEILLSKDVGSPDGDCKIYGYWDNKTMVITRIEHTNPTPSPLEIEEIEELGECFNLIDNINILIRNQKKLYQYIKEKKI